MSRHITSAFYDSESMAAAFSARRGSCRMLAMLFCVLMMVTFISSGTMLALTSNSSSVASADEEDPKKTLEDALKVYDEKAAGGSPEALSAMVEKSETGTSRDDFQSVITRILSPGYLNHTPEGVGRDGKDRLSNCNINDPGAGTAMYHNCDVPNISAELLQKVVSLMGPMGPSGATIESSKAPFGLGIPSNIPNEIVPLNKNDRNIKYTGLELFGYNMRYTTYAGEWDQIQTMTTARAMLNFGFMDSLRLGARSVVNGVIGGFNNGISKSVSELENGDILGAVGGFFTGAFEGGASATVHTVLDTSDLNVFNSNAWYRVNYGNTLYNARELSQPELKAVILASFTDMISKESPEQAKVPDDFNSLRGGPPKPKESTATCTGPSGSVITAPSESDCQRLDGTWNESGGGQGETLVEWKKANDAYFKSMKKYKLNCEIDTGEGNRANKLSTFYSCIEREWAAKEAGVLQTTQEEQDQSWLDKLLTPVRWSIYLKTNPRGNFNSPMNRFVCTDANGKDIKSGRASVFYFTEAGKKDDRCQEMRPPIQNGYYGNGYYAPAWMDEYGPGSTEQPEPDTRFMLVNRDSPMSEITSSASTAIANLGLKTAAVATVISNTALDLSFSPIMEKLGVEKKVTALIEGFRDGVFFPLSTILVMVAGVQVLITAGRTKAYGMGLRSAILVVLTFLIGSVALFSPKLLFDIVDRGPAMVENTIVGTIYDVGNPNADQLCAASSGGSGTSEVGLDGRPLEFSPGASSRTMLCDVWRVFVFEPYVAGQWGVSYNELYAAGRATNGGNTLNNTNSSLVGNAEVNLGAGTKINNWGLYQLDVLTSGTTTGDDPESPTGQTPRDFYRIIDAQAGPNNGQGRDGRYLSSWSGRDPMGRMLVGALSGATAIAGAITIVFYSLVKIQLTFMSSLLLLFLPFVLALGLHPTSGRMQLRKYIGTVLSMMFRRVILVTALALMMKVLLAASLASPTYYIQGIMALAICLAFFFLRGRIQELFTDPLHRAFGGKFAEQFTDNPGNALLQALPTSGRNYASEFSHRTKAVAGGALGGYMTGGLHGARKAVFGDEGDPENGQPRYQGAWEMSGRRSEIRQMRRGMGALKSFDRAAEIGKKDAQQRLRSSESLKDANEALRTRYVNDTNRLQQQEREENTRGNRSSEEEIRRHAVEELANNRNETFDAGDRDGGELSLNKDDFTIDLESRGDLRDLRTLEGLDRKIARLEELANRGTRDQKLIDNPNRADIAAAQQRLMRNRREREDKLDNLREERGRILDDIYRRHNDPDWSGKTSSEKMRREVHRMREVTAEKAQAAMGGRGDAARKAAERARKGRRSGFDRFSFEDTVVAMTLEAKRLVEKDSSTRYSKKELAVLAERIFTNLEQEYQSDRSRMTPQERDKALQHVIDMVVKEGR